MKRNRYGKAAIFKPSEISKVRRAISSDVHRLFFEIALYTGERAGAIAQLQVSDVYAPNGSPLNLITFRSSTRKRSPNGKAATRQVPIHPELRQFLRSYPPPSGGYLFPSPRDRNKHISYDAFYQYQQKIFERCGLDYRGFSTHSTRRYLINSLVRNGVNLEIIRQVTGHKSLNTLKEYIDDNPDICASAIATLNP